MSREAALEFVGRVVADGPFSDQLALALANVADPADRLAAVAAFAARSGYETTATDLVPFLPADPAELGENDLGAIAGGVGSRGVVAMNCLLPARFRVFGVICPEPPARR